MAKPNKNETAAEKLARLRAEMAEVEKMAAAEQKEQTDKVNERISNLHTYLGLESIGAAFIAVSAYRKGLNAGKTGLRGSRLSDESRALMDKLLGEGKQVSEVVKATGISSPTVYKRRKELEAAKAAPAAPAAEAPAAAPAAQ